MEAINPKTGVMGTEMLDFTPSSMQTDLTEEDSNDSLRSYNCNYPDCEKTFRYRSEIIRHIVTHTNHRPYVCPYKDCCKGFKRSDALATHIRIHTGDKPFMCPVGSCQLGFSTKAGLRYHVLKHKNDKLYKCDHPGCDQSFLTMSQLKQHKRSTKVHEILQSPKIQPAENPHSPHLNRYEPALQKRVHIDQMQADPVSTSQQFSIIDMKVKTTKFEPEKGGLNAFYSESQPLQKSDSDIGFFSNAIFQSPNLPVLKPVNDCEGACSADQEGLMKKINKVLEENSSLKKHLELCQKIIGIYQSNAETSKRPMFC